MWLKTLNAKSGESVKYNFTSHYTVKENFKTYLFDPKTKSLIFIFCAVLEFIT